MDKPRRETERRAPVVVQPLAAPSPRALSPLSQAGLKTDAVRPREKPLRLIKIFGKDVLSRLTLSYPKRLPSAAAAGLLLVAVGGFLYSYLHSGASSDSAEPAAEAPTIVASAPFDFEIPEVEPLEPDMSARENTVIAAPVPAPVPTPAHFTPASAALPAAEATASSSKPEGPTTVALAEKQTTGQNPSIEPAKTEPIKTEDKQPVAPTVEAKKPAVQVKQESEAKKPTVQAKQEKEKTSDRADFLVVGPSFVRAQPTAGAAIIDTLSPGTFINVAGRTGEYYQIRSVGANPIRGYIHKEDAFFERKK